MSICALHGPSIAGQLHPDEAARLSAEFERSGSAPKITEKMRCSRKHIFQRARSRLLEVRPGHAAALLAAWRLLKWTPAERSVSHAIAAIASAAFCGLRLGSRIGSRSFRRLRPQVDLHCDPNKRLVRLRLVTYLPTDDQGISGTLCNNPGTTACTS